MTIESALGFFMALLVWVAIPGPAILAIVGRSLTAGMGPALRLIAGILLGDIFYITIVLLGMAAAGRILGEYFVVLRVLGACYLIFLGLRLWFKRQEQAGGFPNTGRNDGYKSFLAGFGITLGNPKAILFHLGFLPTFFDLTRIDLLDALLIVGIFLAVLGSSLTLYAYAASRARVFFNDPRKLRFLNRLSGTVLIGAGIAVLSRR